MQTCNERIYILIESIKNKNLSINSQQKLLNPLFLLLRIFTQTSHLFILKAQK